MITRHQLLKCATGVLTALGLVKVSEPQVSRFVPQGSDTAPPMLSSGERVLGYRGFAEHFDFASRHEVFDLIAYPNADSGSPIPLRVWRKSNPSNVLLSAYLLNPGSTFRWVAAPGHEIILLPGDRLAWSPDFTVRILSRASGTIWCNFTEPMTLPRPTETPLDESSAAAAFQDLGGMPWSA